MGKEEEETSFESSVPSAAPTINTSEELEATTDSDDPPPPIAEIIDRSGDPEAEAKSLELKQKGNEELMKGHYLQAIQFYSDALEYTPNNAIVLSNRAQAYIKVENYGLALEDATGAIDSDASYAKAYYRRASAHFALNKFKAARKDFRTVCKLKPKDRDARAKLVEVEKVIRAEAFAAAIVSAETAPLSATYDPNDIHIDPSSYDGPNPLMEGPMDDMDAEAQLFQPGNLPMEFVRAAIERFRDRNLIHKRYVARLLLTCNKYFESISSLMEISIPTDPPSHDESAAPRITVCGDTHGQFYDVLNVFQLNGFPSETNPYLFNGDFVDRGSFSVEVILTFLLIKIACPNAIYLTRGNHETKNMNRIYGFEGEVRAKYDEKIFQLFLEVFGHLPLAAVLKDEIFVTHGGLPVTPNVTLDDIKKIPRGCEPPDSGLMSDLLWSDPQPFQGKSPSKRGVGFSFGPDITEAFLEKNNLKLVVRSHEVKEEGYLVEHGGKCITVFSAPNYCDTMGNKAAFIHIDASLEAKFTQYNAVDHPDVKPMAYAAGMGGMAGLFA